MRIAHLYARAGSGYFVRCHTAGYDTIANAARGPRTPETRTNILNQLVRWCNSLGIMVYWLNGIIGTGKTTIAYTLCEMLVVSNLLAAFFCSLSLPDCRDINILLPTITF
jgi:hypothetical protein